MHFVEIDVLITPIEADFFIKMIGEKAHASTGGGMNRYLKYDIINI